MVQFVENSSKRRFTVLNLVPSQVLFLKNKYSMRGRLFLKQIYFKVLIKEQWYLAVPLLESDVPDMPIYR